MTGQGGQVRYSAEQVERVRRNFSLEALVTKRTKLTRAGRGFKGLCPFHKERSPSFTVNTEGGFYHCFGCGAHGDLFDWLLETEGWGFLDAMQRLLGGEVPDARRPSHAVERQALKAPSTVVSSTTAGRWIFQTSGPARGEIVERWLKSRGLDPLAEFVPGEPAIDQLRFHARCPLGAWRVDADPNDAREAPAMVAPWRDREGMVRGVHVTWLSPDGRDKARLPALRDGSARPGRKMFGKVGGCAVFLSPFGTGPEVGPLVVGEGIETSWSFAQALGRPCRVAAALSLENMQGHPVRLRGGAIPLWNVRADPERPPFLLDEPGEVMLVVDADMKPLRDIKLQRQAGALPTKGDLDGEERARICGQLATQHWRAAGGLPVSAMRPPMGMDFNDQVRRAANG